MKIVIKYCNKRERERERERFEREERRSKRLTRGKNDVAAVTDCNVS